VSNLIQDLKFGVRSFLRAPRFSIPAVLALALGIGATSATFSVVRGVMLKPLPYSQPDRIVGIWEMNARRPGQRNVVAPANFVAWTERNKSFEHLAMVGPARLNLLLGTQPSEVTGLSASSELFAALGVTPAIGRAYNGAEDLQGNDLVIVISHEFWQARFGGRSDLVGSTIDTNGRLRTVLGVMPPGFTVAGQKADFLIPYGWNIEQLRGAPGRGSSYALARLRDGVSIEQAADEMKTIAAQLASEAPQRNTGWSVLVVPIHEQMIEQIRPALMVLAGAVALVLLIACVNVANLLLARCTVRERELAVRAALGARRGRLILQLLIESVLLGVAGGLSGLLLAVAFHRGLLALVATRIPVPRLEQVALDTPVLALTMLLSAVTGLIFGLAPAIVASRSVNDALREGGRHGASPRARRMLGSLVVIEVALALVLLAGAGLLIRSFMRLQAIDPGFRAEGLITARVSLPGARYDTDEKATRFFDDTLQRTRAIPGVQSAAGVTFLPLSGPGIGTSFYRSDRPTPGPGEQPVTDVRPVTPQFFKTMGIPVIEGRDFNDADRSESPLVAVVSKTLVQRLFPGENAIGRRIHVNVGRAGGMECEIVGVVGDIKIRSLEGEIGPAVYMPHAQLPIGFMTLVARTEMDPSSLVNSVSAAVHAIDPELPLADVKTMQGVVDATISRPRVIAVLLAAFALMALTLAAVGVYGVMAYSVAQRTQEIGVRMAFGATPNSVFRMVLGQALRLIVIGVLAGVVGAGALTRVMKSLLYETEPLDPWTFAVTAVTLMVVAVLASYIPARRGTRIAPVEALRTE
jgi:putative ABC transport system permease protein